MHHLDFNFSRPILEVDERNNIFGKNDGVHRKKIHYFFIVKLIHSLARSKSKIQSFTCDIYNCCSYIPT